MPTILVTGSDADRRAIEFTVGDTLMETLREAGYEEISAICGGSCSCATCHVQIVSTTAALTPMEEDEAMLLELADEYDPQLSRLACQIPLQEGHAGMEVRLIDNS